MRERRPELDQVEDLEQLDVDQVGEDLEQLDQVEDLDAGGGADQPPRGRRRRRLRGPRARTIPVRRLTRAELRHGALMFPPVDDVARPRTRGDCRDDARPCPWVSCRHHLYLDVHPETGSIKINVPDLEPWDMPESCSLDVAESCSLDVAERGGATLEDVGVILNLTRERIRQVEVRALLKLRMASPSDSEVGAALLRRPGD